MEEAMEEEIQRALIKAGAKLGIGLSLLAAVIGIRVITTAPAGVEGEIEELAAIEAELAAETARAESARGSRADREEPEAEPADSLVGRLSKTARTAAGGSGESDPDDAERLVSCQLPGGSQFMRAADCATRGGQSTDL